MTYAGTWQEPANEPGPTSNYWSSAKQTAALVFLAGICWLIQSGVQTPRCVWFWRPWFRWRWQTSSIRFDWIIQAAPGIWPAVATKCHFQLFIFYFFSLQLFLQFLAADSNLESSCSLPLAAGIRPNHLHRREHSPMLRPIMESKLVTTCQFDEPLAKSSTNGRAAMDACPGLVLWWFSSDQTWPDTEIGRKGKMQLAHIRRVSYVLDGPEVCKVQGPLIKVWSLLHGFAFDEGLLSKDETNAAPPKYIILYRFPKAAFFSTN